MHWTRTTATSSSSSTPGRCTASAQRDWGLSLTALPGVLRSGLEVRHDDIDPVGLHVTTARIRQDTIREDSVKQTSYSAWIAHEQRWMTWLRTELGLRADYFEFDVDSDLSANSGRVDDSIVSPKLGISDPGTRRSSSSTTGVVSTATMHGERPFASTPWIR